jgi:DHA1 family multidrug resistance protein-like MFS transporter
MNKKAFAVVVSTMFISMLGMGIVVPLLPIYADSMGASALEIGLINAGFSITLTIFLPIMGRFSDRTGRKVFLCAEPFPTHHGALFSRLLSNDAFTPCTSLSW